MTAIQLRDTTSISELLQQSARVIWKRNGLTTKIPVLTPAGLYEWTSKSGQMKVDPIVNKNKSADEWETRAWQDLVKCYFRHSSDTPASDVKGTEVHHYAHLGMRLLFDVQDTTPDGLGGLKLATVDDALMAIHKVWERVEKKHPNQFGHPLSPIIERCIIDQAPHIKPEQRPEQITFSFLRNSVISEPKVRLPVGGRLHAQAAQMVLPGFETEKSIIVPALPLGVYDTGTGAGRGAPIEERIWINALLALPFGERDAEGVVVLSTTLRDVVSWVYPNGWNRKRRLPLIRKALFNVNNRRITYEKQGWFTVQVLDMPNESTELDDPLRFKVTLPPGVLGNGPMTNVVVMRQYGTESAPKHRAWFRLTYIWDDAKNKNGGSRVYPTIPKVLRNERRYLTYPDGKMVLSGKPYYGKDGKWRAGQGNQPQTAWCHPLATRIGTERNPRADKVSVLTDADMVALFYDDKELDGGSFRNRLRKAKGEALEMEADGNVAIERDVIDRKRAVKGWRIIEAGKPTQEFG